jgi:hypothetical protein
LAVCIEDCFLSHDGGLSNLLKCSASAFRRSRNAGVNLFHSTPSSSNSSVSHVSDLITALRSRSIPAGVMSQIPWSRPPRWPLRLRFSRVHAMRFSMRDSPPRDFTVVAITFLQKMIGQDELRGPIFRRATPANVKRIEQYDFLLNCAGV